MHQQAREQLHKAIDHLFDLASAQKREVEDPILDLKLLASYMNPDGVNMIVETWRCELVSMADGTYQVEDTVGYLESYDPERPGPAVMVTQLHQE